MFFFRIVKNKCRPTHEQVDEPVTSDRVLALEWDTIDVEREENRELPSWLGLYSRVLFVLWAPASCKNLVTQPLLDSLRFSDFLGSSLRTLTRRGMAPWCDPRYCVAFQGLARHRNHLEWLR